jgi:hypothetical protein
VLLKDHTGKMIIAKSLTRREYLSPIEAEALATNTATQICRAWGMDRVMFVVDAKGITDLINRGERSWNMGSPII